MFKSLRGRIILILATVALSSWAIYNYGIQLGLDLQGGMHLELGVDESEVVLTEDERADAIERLETIIRNRINELGVREPLVQRKGGESIIVELAGAFDPERAKDILRQNAYLEWRLVRNDAQFFTPAILDRIDRAIVRALGADSVRALMGEGTGVTQEALADILSGETGGADTTGAAADTAGAEGDTIEAEADTATVPSPADLNPFSSIFFNGDIPQGSALVAAGDKEIVDLYLALSEVQRAIPDDLELLWGAEEEARGVTTYWQLYVLDSEPFITGDMLVNAIAGRDPQYNEAVVDFELNRRGGSEFQDVTRQHIGDFIAIILDNRVMSAPVVRAEIGRRGQIQLGQADLAEARDLALVLRAGALPVPIEILTEVTVGPSLGTDSIEQGKLAGIIGVVLVILIMMLYYRTAGMLAVVALGVYVVLVFGALAGFGADLTLPGLAGLVLSVGMAVDANVLIFERIREELTAGRATRTAVDEGFGNALSAIVDANLTTLITALILFQFGTGPVRGFAVTLSIGIVASFFTALYVTRTLFLIYLSGKKASDPISI